MNETPTASERWITKPELARVLGVSVRTIENLHHDGLPSISVGRLRRYRESEVLAWLSSH